MAYPVRDYILGEINMLSNINPQIRIIKYRKLLISFKPRPFFKTKLLNPFEVNINIEVSKTKPTAIAAPLPKGSSSGALFIKSEKNKIFQITITIIAKGSLIGKPPWFCFSENRSFNS